MNADNGAGVHKKSAPVAIVSKAEKQKRLAEQMRKLREESVIEAIDAGLSIGEITDKFQCDADTIRAIAHRNNRRVIGNRSARWTGKVIANLRQLWAEGISVKEIGERLGFSKNAIVGKVHTLGLPQRPHAIKRRDPNAPPKQVIRRIKEATLPPLPSEQPKAPPVIKAKPAPKLFTTVAVVPPRPVAVPPKVSAPLPFRVSRQCTAVESIGKFKWKQCEGQIARGSFCQSHADRFYRKRGDVEVGV